MAEIPLNPPEGCRIRQRGRGKKKKNEEQDQRKNVVPGKINIINEETFKKLRSELPDTSQKRQQSVKNKRFREAAQLQYALSDFVIVKKQEATPRRRPKRNVTTTVLRRGKVRETPKKKSLSKLKRAIVSIRASRKKELAEGQVGIAQEQDIPEVIHGQVSLPISYSRKFRTYCNHFNNPDIKANAEKLLNELFRFQDRAFERNQLKAQAHRRYVVGFKEAERCLSLDKVKILLIACDLEPNPGSGGIDETVDRFKDTCKKKCIPYCFPLQRRKIGYLLYKKAPISCVAVLDYDGAEEITKALLREVKKSRICLDKEMEKLQIK